MAVPKGTRSTTNVDRRRRSKRAPVEVDFTPFPVVPKGKTPESVTQFKRTQARRAQKAEIAARQSEALLRTAFREPARERVAKYGFVGASAVSQLQNQVAAERRRQEAIRDRQRAAREDAERRSRQRAEGWRGRALGGIPLVGGLLRQPEVAQPALNLGESAGYLGGSLAGKVAELFQTPTYGGVRGRYSPAAIQVGAGAPVAVRATQEAAPMLAKILAGGGGGVTGGVRNPGRVAEEFVEIAKGGTQMVGMVAAMASPSVTKRQRQQMAEQVIDSAIDDWMRRYGPDTSINEAFEIGQENPVSSTLDAIAVLAPGAKAASIARYLKAGATFKEARMLSRTPARAPEILGERAPKRAVRNVRVYGRGETPYDVEISQSRSPIMRTAGRGYDIAGRAVERLPGGQRVPLVTPSRRGIRAEKQRLRRDERRAIAAGQVLWRDVNEFTRGKRTVRKAGRREQDVGAGAALSYAMQKPADVDTGEWLQALRTDIEQMLEGRAIERTGEPSAAEAKLARRLERFRKTVDRASSARWQRRVDEISREQERINGAILDNEQEVKATRAARAEIEADPDLDEATKVDMLASYDADLQRLDGERAALREELAPFEVEQAPVVSPSRDQLEERIQSLPNVTPDQAQGVLGLLDARARSWATKEGRDPGEWYDDPNGFGVEDVKLIRDVTDLPERVRTDIEAGTQPVRAMAQTRQSDLLGAVEYLNSEDGARIVYLTEQADVSTLLSELIGHSTREMKAAYPDEFAAVENLIGRELGDWTTDDHERFNRTFERWVSSGRAPTPELVPVFARIKTWMRSIYGGLQKIMGENVPLEVSSLFETYFGAYDDVNVFRVAAMETKIPEDVRVGYYGALFDFTGEELAQLRRRNDARAYARSLEGMKAKIDELQGKDDLTADEIELLNTKSAEYHKLSSQAAYDAADRETKLRRRLVEIDKAMTNPGGRRYEGALDSLNALMDMREEIFRSIFGDKYDTVFDNREDLLADWLVDQGLLAPDFEKGSARYVPHLPEGGGAAPRGIVAPARALVSRVIGKTDTRLLNLHRRNSLQRWQKGDYWADPIAVFEAWQNAASFAYVHGLKERMWDIGRPLRVDEPVPEGVYVINRNGIPIPNLQKRSLQPGATRDVQDVLDALDARDPEKVDKVMLDYTQDIFMKPEDLAKKIEGGVDPDTLDLRIVDARIVDGLFRPLKGSSTLAGQLLIDIPSTLSRWSLIYSNPSYVPIQFIGNVGFLLGQQGPWAVRNLVRASSMALKNRRLFDEVGAEVGELPSFAAISRGRARSGRGERSRAAERKVLGGLSFIPDKIPRTAAWIYEARREGFKSEDDIFRLLRSKDAQAVRTRNIISERATEVMVNFDRLSDVERMYLTRVLFVWPWIRGATAWPFYYAREFPVQTAVASEVALALEERRDEMVGETSVFRESLFPIEKKDGKLQVLNPGSISPTGTVAESVESLRQNILSLLSGEEAERGHRLVDYVSPLIQLATMGGAQYGEFGQKMSTRDLLLDNALSFVPYLGTVQQATDPSKVSTIFDDRSAKGVLKRRFARITPEQVDLARLNALAPEGEKTTESKIRAKEDDLRKEIRKLGGDPLIPRSVTYSLGLQEIYGDARENLKEQLRRQRNYHPGPGRTEPDLSDQQEAALAYAMVERYAPGLAENMLAPDQVPGDMLDAYTNAILWGNKEYRVEGLFQPLTDFRAEIQKEKRRQKKGS